MAKNTTGNKRSMAFLVFRIVLRLVIYAVAVMILVTCVKKAYHFGYSVFTMEVMAEDPGEDVVVTISEGMSSKAVGELLESKGLIRDGSVYTVQAIVYKYKPLPGTYVLNTSQNIKQMVDVMTVAEEETEEDKNIIPTKKNSTQEE
ncbi:MAG: hypothetical protein PUB22_00465 [Clostridiales bacterium]|nr:hypothetical protein [Clostridiales bacterium]